MAIGQTNVAALNAAAAAALNGGTSDASSVAVMERPVKVKKAPAAKPVKEVKPKVTAKVKAAAAEVSEADVLVLDNIRKMSINVRSAEVKPEDRKIAVAAAISIMVGVGLGERSKGYGPHVRAVLTRLLGGKLGSKTVNRDKISAKDVIEICEAGTFKEQAAKALDTYLAGLKPDAGEATLATRAKNAEQAKRWVTAGLNTTYATALKVILTLGGQVNFGTDKGTISMPVDRALGVAFGRSITASELAKAGEKGVTK
jgi:hypothetical protein